MLKQSLDEVQLSCSQQLAYIQRYKVCCLAYCTCMLLLMSVSTCTLGDIHVTCTCIHD